MKRETIIGFGLTVLLAAVSAIYGTVWKINDKLSLQGERLARIEARLDAGKTIAQKP